MDRRNTPEWLSIALNAGALYIAAMAKSKMFAGPVVVQFEIFSSLASPLGAQVICWSVAPAGAFTAGKSPSPGLTTGARICRAVRRSTLASSPEILNYTTTGGPVGFSPIRLSKMVFPVAGEGRYP